MSGWGGCPSSRRSMDVNETLPRFLLLLRFLCFVAVVYLILHVLFARLISKPDSKVLWFFSTLTMPLTWPILVASASRSIRIPASICCAGFLWRAVGDYSGCDGDGPSTLH